MHHVVLQGGCKGGVVYAVVLVETLVLGVNQSFLEVLAYFMEFYRCAVFLVVFSY